MLTAILLPLLMMPGRPAPDPALQQADPPIKVWLNDESFERGDQAKVYVKADRDGYVVVLHAGPDGRVRVLFPLDPTDDDYIKAGDTYEVRGRGDRSAFTVYDSQGEGVVFAVYSPDPFQFDNLVRSDHWDYRAEAFRVGDDAEADLTDLARQMAGQSQFEYDLVRYDVEQYVARGGSYYPYYPYYPYYDGWYDPWYRPWHSGVYFGVSFGSPWYYSCWYCDPWYANYYYSDYYYYRGWYRPYYYNPYYYGRSWWGGNWYSPYRYRGRPSVIYTAFGGRNGVWGSRYGGQQRYGFNYAQPGRRTLSFYDNPGPSDVELRRRVVIPPTDIVLPASNVPRARRPVETGTAAPSQAPGRRTEPNTGPAKPRSVDPSRQVEPSRRPDTTPRGLVPMREVREPSRQGPDRSRSLREVSPRDRQPMVREPSRQDRPDVGERPRLERRAPERGNAPSQARPSAPRTRSPSASSPRYSPPPRVSSPPRSGGGSSAPRAAPRSGGGGGGGRSQPSPGRRRG